MNDIMTVRLHEVGKVSAVVKDAVVVEKDVPGVGVPPGGASGQVLTKLSGADYDTGWRAAIGGGENDHSKLTNRDAQDQHPIGAIAGLAEALDGKQPKGDYLTADTLQDATDAALAQAKDSGAFDGAPGAPGEKGDKGDTGPAGPQGPAGAPGKDAATDISLGITGATVGQIAKITVVDASGVPTAWSPVDMPTGGNESSFEKVVEMTTAEDAAVISISTDKNGNPLSMSEFYVAITTARNNAATANNYFNCNVLPDTVPSYIRTASAIKNLMLFQDVYCYVMHYKVVGGMIFCEYSSRRRTESGLNAAEYLENEKSIGIAVMSGETIGFLSPTDASNGESKVNSAGKMYCITFGADNTECVFGAGTRVEVWAK